MDTLFKVEIVKQIKLWLFTAIGTMIVHKLLTGGKEMEKDLQLGPEAKASLKVEAGKVVIAVDYVGAQASAGLSVSLDVDQFALLLKNAIPGQIDDTIIDILVAALKVV